MIPCFQEETHHLFENKLLGKTRAFGLTPWSRDLLEQLTVAQKIY
jgi:hypothetical protein